MYQIIKSENKISKLREYSFSELGFEERAHLQEWVANEPECLGEELLIIQKEFAGFSDTKERLDLLALDKSGSLVIIENKLDDSGRDVTWQSLKYASYCSNLTKENIRQMYQEYLDKNTPSSSAVENICEFLDAKDDWDNVEINKGPVSQRIILIAANFRREVTNTVLWLLQNKLRIQCFKVTPFGDGISLFLSVDQIVPTKTAEEFMIRMADKAQDEMETQAAQNRYAVRKRFWEELLTRFSKCSDLFSNVNPRKEAYIGTGSGVGAVWYNFVITKSFCRVELYLDRTKEENKFLFDELMKSQVKIQEFFDQPLAWERLNDKKASRIKLEIPANVFDDAMWEMMFGFLIDSMPRMEKAFKTPLMAAAKKMKAAPSQV